MNARESSRIRETLLHHYDYAQTWATKLNRMPDNQVLAIYLRLKKAGKVA